MAKLIENGYGQLELNQVAFRRDGRIIAQYKLAIDKAENGMLLAVDHVNKTIGYPTAGQVKGLALNYTTEHMYDERLVHGLKHFVVEKDGVLPRLGILAEGDRFTTNAVEYTGELDALKAAIAGGTVYGHAGANGYIVVDEAEENAVLKAIEYTTMPDGQAAIKFVAL